MSCPAQAGHPVVTALADRTVNTGSSAFADDDARGRYLRASCTNCHTRDGDSGRSRGSTPRDESASATALAITPPTEMMPPSPAPLAPSGLIGEGCDSITKPRIFGKSLAVGMR